MTKSLCDRVRHFRHKVYNAKEQKKTTEKDKNC